MALEYGHIVYAVEEIDNPDNFDSIKAGQSDPFVVQKQDDLLGGVNTLESGQLKAIPYYAWSNRGIGKMKVWLNFGG